MEGSIHSSSARKMVHNFLLEYVKMCKAFVGTNALDEEIYIESAKE
jgi:hypothetical protein